MEIVETFEFNEDISKINALNEHKQTYLEQDFVFVSKTQIIQTNANLQSTTIELRKIYSKHIIARYLIVFLSLLKMHPR